MSDAYALDPVADHALVDGLPVPGLPCTSTAIVKGDACSLSIAAASIVAKVHDLANSLKFRKAGADALASPQVIGGLRLVSELIRPSVVSFLDIMLRDTDRTIRIDEIRVGASSPHARSNLKQLGARAKHKVQILAIKSQGSEHFEYIPDPEEPIGAGSTLIVLGDAADVDKLRKALHTGAPSD